MEPCAKRTSSSPSGMRAASSSTRRTSERTLVPASRPPGAISPRKG